MKVKSGINELNSDIAPLEGRSALKGWPPTTGRQGLTWQNSSWLIAGSTLKAQPARIKLRLQGRLTACGDTSPKPGWIEMEAGQVAPIVLDLWLVGSRPLPSAEITCICRCPGNPEWLVAATATSTLLVLDGRLDCDLKILAQTKLKADYLISLAACGQRLVGLLSGEPRVQFIDIKLDPSGPILVVGEQYSLPFSLVAVAENDAFNIWGLDAKGNIFNIQWHPQQENHNLPLPPPAAIACTGHLQRRSLRKIDLIGYADYFWKLLKSKQLTPGRVSVRSGSFGGLAYDGRNLWSFCQAASSKPAVIRQHRKRISK